MFKKYILVASLALIFVVTIEAAKILAVFPTPSISHQVVFRPLTQELAKRGHEVVVITTDPAFPKGQTPRNLTEIDIHDISYEIWVKRFLSADKGKKGDIYGTIKQLLDILTDTIERQFQSDEIKNLIKDKDKQFDLLFIEACARPAMVFSHIYKVPVIQTSSLGSVFDTNEIVGAPTHPLFFPSVIHQKIFNLTLWEKVKTFYNELLFQYLYKSHEDMENEVIRRYFGSDVPSLSELVNNVHMMFLNVHPIWEMNRPVPPNVVYMGGLHQKPAKELPQDLKSYLNNSKNGVVYVSFGTNVSPSLLPPEKIRVLVTVFSQLPYDVLLKWDKDTLPSQSKNIKVAKWLPQSDLLRHPKIKLFITQGGLQSTDEAITAGVPLIGIPMLGDQWYNVEQYLHHKIGLRLDMETLTEKELKDAINTVTGDESYRHNVAQLRSVMYDQPLSSLDRAVWWTEYVLRHGGARHLRSPIANITWSQYLQLELVAIVFVVLLSSIAVLVTLFHYVWTHLSKNVKDVVKIKFD